MPKRFSIVDKRRWLDDYEHGKTEAGLASASNCDVRTIKKGIEEARRERDSQTARSELVKQALVSHQEKLKGALDEILKSVTMPAMDWVVLPWNQDWKSVSAKDGGIAPDSPAKAEKASKVSAVRADLVQELLREHLKSEKMWRLLSSREKMLAANRRERIALQRKVVSILQEETGYQMAYRGIPGLSLLTHIVGDLFLGMALRWASSKDNDTAWQDEIVINRNRGMVEYHESTLAVAPGAEEDCRKKLLAAFDKLKGLPETAQVVKSQDQLEEETLKARRAIEEILLLGLIPGLCRVCRRLGG